MQSGGIADVRESPAQYLDVMKKNDRNGAELPQEIKARKERCAHKQAAEDRGEGGSQMIISNREYARRDID